MKGVWSFMLDARLAQLGTSGIARHCEERRRALRLFRKVLYEVVRVMRWCPSRDP